MINTIWYLSIVTILIGACSLWATASNSNLQSHKEKLRYFQSTVVNCAISAIAYWILVFILSLVIAAGIWLFLLLMVWVPSDLFQNYFGTDIFTKALQSIKPAIYKNAASPGITHIPLLDYISLSAAYLLGPWLGIWSIINQTQSSSGDVSPQPQN